MAGALRVKAAERQSGLWVTSNGNSNSNNNNNNSNSNSNSSSSKARVSKATALPPVG
ncbi:MAG: hypothetical protein M3Q11_10030 [Pseudomonadota bacterium]|nr:hypothetical protein [Pseudomonadota bacterium]